MERDLDITSEFFVATGLVKLGRCLCPHLKVSITIICMFFFVISIETERRLMSGGLVRSTSVAK